MTCIQKKERKTVKSNNKGQSIGAPTICKPTIPMQLEERKTKPSLVSVLCIFFCGLSTWVNPISSALRPRPSNMVNRVKTRKPRNNMTIMLATSMLPVMPRFNKLFMAYCALFGWAISSERRVVCKDFNSITDINIAPTLITQNHGLDSSVFGASPKPINKVMEKALFKA